MPGCKFLHTQENVTPDFELFDLTRTAAPNDSRNRHTSHTVGPIAPIADAAGVLREKTKFCAFVFSNPHCATRNRFLEILARHHRIDSVGRAFFNLPQVPYPAWRTLKFYRSYKFVIAFENSLSLHYASEKLGVALMGDTVPIYWGNVHIAQYFNPERFINAFDFDSLESLAAHVMRVHADDALYLRYLSAPSGTPRRRQRRVSNLQWMVHRQFKKKRKRLLNGRALPLAQRRMFHRECLSRFGHEACNQIVADRLHLAGWPDWGGVSRRVSVTSRNHIWPHPAFYQVVDMDGRLDVKAS